MQREAHPWLTAFFYPSFFVLNLLSLFLFESNLGWFLFLPWLLFFWIYRYQVKRENKKFVGFFIVSWFVFLLSLIFNFIFSREWFLGIRNYLEYALLFVYFIFFFFLSEKNSKRIDFLFYGNFFIFFLNLLVLGLTFLPDWNGIFPGMSLVVRKYGHNHFAGLLLIFLPLIWYQLLQPFFEHYPKARSKWQTAFLWILIIVSYTVMILSFARVAICIALIQIVLFSFLLWRKKYQNHRYQLWIKVLWVFASIFLVSLCLSLFFAFPLFQGQTFFCQADVLQKSLCEPLFENSRFRYWQTALLTFWQYPWFGSGFGTFMQMSRQMALGDLQITSYAHNIFLQNMAEGGITSGVSFIVLIIGLLLGSGQRVYQAYKNKQKEAWWLTCLFVAVVSSLINAQFDYDWSFFIIASFTVFLLTCIMRTEKSKYQLPTWFSVFLTIGRDFFIGTIIAILSLTALAWLFSRTARTDVLVQYFPFSRSSILLLLKQQRLPPEEIEQLFPLYQYDSDFITYALEESNDLSAEMRFVLLQQKSVVDPLAYTWESDLAAFIPSHSNQAKQLYQLWWQNMQTHQLLKDDLILSYADKTKKAAELVALANQLYQENDEASAAVFYNRATQVREYILANEPLTFLQETNSAKQANFLWQFEIEPKLLGEKFSAFMDQNLISILYYYQQGEVDKAVALSQKLFRYEPNFAYFVFKAIIERSPSDNSRFRPYYQATKNNEKWLQFDQNVISSKLQE